MLSPFYLITPEFRGDQNTYLTQLSASLLHGVRLIQFRSKNLSCQDYIKLAKRILLLTKAHGAKLILNAPLTMRDKIEADGFHLPSIHLTTMKQRPLPDHYLLSLACHNPQEVHMAEKIHANLVLVSPIFATLSCLNRKPLGWDNFEVCIKNVDIPAYALGGLGIQDCVQAKSRGAYGLAAIRSLWGLTQDLPVI